MTDFDTMLIAEVRDLQRQREVLLAELAAERQRREELEREVSRLRPQDYLPIRDLC